MNAERTLGNLSHFLPGLEPELYVRIAFEPDSYIFEDDPNRREKVGHIYEGTVYHFMSEYPARILDENYVIAVLAGDETKGIDAYIVCISL